VTPDQLRIQRRRFGLTQVELGMRLGVDGRTVRRWEAGDRKISAMAVRLIATLSISRARSRAPSESETNTERRDLDRPASGRGLNYFPSAIR
jgi:transcriptional regulator with XRE-family HTH domain